MVDDFGFVKTDDCLRQCVIVGISDYADRSADICVCQSLRIMDREILAASVAVVDELSAVLASPQRLFKRSSIFMEVETFQPTMQRATGMASLLNCSQTLRAP